MRVLLIGGNGFLGSRVTRNLRAEGHSVAVLHRSADAHPDDGVVRIQGDRNRLSDSLEQLRRFSPQVIIDLILSSGEQARKLMNTVRGIAQRVVAISSMDVYRAWGIVHQSEPGPPEPLPLTEDSPVRANRRLYTPETIKRMQSIFSWLDESYDKIAVEEAVLNISDVAGTVLRLPMVYGPGDPLHRLFPLLKRFADGRSFILVADDLAAWRGPRGYIENVAHAIALAATLEHAAGRIYNVCDEPVSSELAWQKRIAAQTEWQGEFVVLPRERTPKHLLQPGNAAQHVVVSSERIRAELSYKEPVDPDEALRRTIAWEQSNPPAVIELRQFDYEAEDEALDSRA
ncbi:MAG: NAD-dependent epimerase/dehydratase family protein [Acidobacteriaceae bacterium]